MARRRDVGVVYLAGLIQGVALVTFPAIHAVLTGASSFGLSNGKYGALFVPQAALAIATSLLSAAARKHVGVRTVYLVGLAANLLAMSLLLVSRVVIGNQSLAYLVLLGATASLGAGFGFTVPALNTFAARFFPQRVDRAVLAMNALLGLGTALAPVAVAIFVKLGRWWMLPVVVAVSLAAVLIISMTLRLNAPANPASATNRRGARAMPRRFWLFAALTLLYGICETMNGTWAVPLVTTRYGLGAAAASAVLAVFWGMITLGRILFAAIERWVPERLVLRVLPFVVAGACGASLLIPKQATLLAIALFAVAGLGCSALLPLAISTAQTRLKVMEGSVAGLLIASYQVGYGLAAFGVGALHSAAGIGLGVAYASTAAIALGMAVLAAAVSRA
jgi:fucose permease